MMLLIDVTTAIMNSSNLVSDNTCRRLQTVVDTADPSLPLLADNFSYFLYAYLYWFEKPHYERPSQKDAVYAQPKKYRLSG